MTDSESEEVRGQKGSGELDQQLKALQADENLQRFRESRECMAADPYRPLYHFSSPMDSIGDPNGLCQWKGRYHLFYQFALKGSGRVWGHAASDDLVHWRDLPPALYPDQEGACFSGQTLVERDRVIAIYHGTGSGNGIATSCDPLLVDWTKHPGNPVIPIVPIDDNGTPYRIFDPCIWKERDGYYALSGTYKDGELRVDCRSVDHLFRSKDLTEWEYLGPLVEDGFFTEPGEDRAVPNFWPIGNGKHMLLFFSHKRAAQYYIGDYDRIAHRFMPTYHGRMNYGPIGVGSLHAPSATIDEDGRFLALFNVTEGKVGQGWHGVMTVPRYFSLADDNSLRISPATGLETLRFGGRRVEPMEICANEEVVLEGIGGKAMEIEAVIDVGAAREAGLCVLRSPDGAEHTRTSLFRGAGTDTGACRLQVDVSAASLRSDVSARTSEVGPLRLDEGEPLRLRVFVDRSIIEVFANGRQCLTIRAYPERQDSVGVSIFARGGAVRLLPFEAWQMRIIWPELTDREGR